MKVGTDGVLLGAWAQVAPTDRRILDIGTGTGLIALMMAQRAPEALVTGVDIGSVEEARANAEASPWASRQCFYCAPVQEFRPEAGERYDLILSNPPSSSIRSPVPTRGGRGCVTPSRFRSTSCAMPSFGCWRPAGALR